MYIQGLQKQAEILLVNIIPSCWGRILCKSYILRNVSSGSVLTFSTSDAQLPFCIAFMKKKSFQDSTGDLDTA